MNKIKKTHKFSATNEYGEQLATGTKISGVKAAATRKQRDGYIIIFKDPGREQVCYRENRKWHAVPVIPLPIDPYRGPLVDHKLVTETDITEGDETRYSAVLYYTETPVYGEWHTEYPEWQKRDLGIFVGPEAFAGKNACEYVSILIGLSLDHQWYLNDCLILEFDNGDYIELERIYENEHE